MGVHKEWKYYDFLDIRLDSPIWPWLPSSQQPTLDRWENIFCIIHLYVSQKDVGLSDHHYASIPHLLWNIELWILDSWNSINFSIFLKSGSYILLIKFHLIIAAGGLEVLDVGCGQGAALRLMAKAFPKTNFTGFDISHGAITAAKNAAGKQLNHNFDRCILMI